MPFFLWGCASTRRTRGSYATDGHSNSFDSGKANYMARFARHEIFQLLHHITSFMGMSLCTTLKKITRIDKETYQRTAQESLIEIAVYSNLWQC